LHFHGSRRKKTSGGGWGEGETAGKEKGRDGYANISIKCSNEMKRKYGAKAAPKEN